MTYLIPDTCLTNIMEPNSVHSSLLSVRLDRLTPTEREGERGREGEGGGGEEGKGRRRGGMGGGRGIYKDRGADHTQVLPVLMTHKQLSP
jgi:hypothetical protein